MGGDTIEQGFDLGLDFREESRLSVLQFRLGDEFEMLESVSVRLVRKVIKRNKDNPTLVACRTLAKRGKSLVPESRMLMDESSSCMLERSDETQLSRVFVVLMV